MADVTDTDAAVDEPEHGRMTLVEHLAELRSRLFKSIVAVVVGGLVCWIFYNQILEFLVQPYCDIRGGDCGLYVTDPLEGFKVRLQVSGYGGIALAMPVILWQLWRFITPGLYKHERRYAVPFVASSVTLFVMGAALAFWTLPKALEFLIDIGGTELQEIYSPNKYLTLIVYMMLAFGIGFEFPILLIFAQMAGLLTPEQLASGRRWAIVIIFVVVAVLTPSGDPYSQIVLAVPMVLFYEAAIIVGKLMRRRKNRAAEAAA
ncbi:MAG: twin-arginine translocase subunit TatC [Acidimicrobiales bacterium]|nr:twin-arginine translocase subunit TatC [Acidimicrobiales bacterium]MCB9372661.1 twin-arginine translocase subunit TatC [Microthrixaceae bacterium]